MRRRARHRQLQVRSLSAASVRGFVEIGSLRLPCALGRSGSRALKHEGDGATPIGCWPVREAFYRADRIGRPRTRLKLRPILESDGWCDAIGDRNYNRRVRHPYPASAEDMRREDGLYDLMVVLGHNDRPRVQGLGSAVFMHVARPDWKPTAGCVALRLADLVKVLRLLDARSRVRIGR